MFQVLYLSDQWRQKLSVLTTLLQEGASDILLIMIPRTETSQKSPLKSYHQNMMSSLFIFHLVAVLWTLYLTNRCLIQDLYECFSSKHSKGASLVVQMVKNLPSVWEAWVQSLGWEDPLEEGMATQSSIWAWRIPLDRGAWWAMVYRVAKSWTQLSDFHFFF